MPHVQFRSVQDFIEAAVIPNRFPGMEFNHASFLAFNHYLSIKLICVSIKCDRIRKPVAAVYLLAREQTGYRQSRDELGSFSRRRIW